MIAAGTVLEMLQLFVPTFGAEGDLFEFLGLPMTPEQFEEEAKGIITQPLSYTRFGPYPD